MLFQKGDNVLYVLLHVDFVLFGSFATNCYDGLRHDVYRGVNELLGAKPFLRLTQLLLGSISVI